MRGVNLVVVVGTAGKDAETRYTGSGSAVTNFTLAVNEYWTDKTTKEKQERTEWVRCVAFGKLGEIVGQFLKKGGKVYAQGKMVTRSWDKDGQKHYTTEVHVDQFQLLDSRGEAAGPTHRGGDEDYRGHNGSNQPNPTYTPAAGGGGGDFDDSIPFNRRTSNYAT